MAQCSCSIFTVNRPIPTPTSISLVIIQATPRGVYCSVCFSAHTGFVTNHLLTIKLTSLNPRFLKFSHPHHFIVNVLGDVKRRYFWQGLTNRDGPLVPTISLPHNDFTEKFIKSVFKSQGIRVVDKTTNTFGAAMFSKKCSPTTPIPSQAGVYVIPCNDCNRCYVGQTGQLRRRSTTHRQELAHSTGGKP